MARGFSEFGVNSYLLKNSRITPKVYNPFTD
jgi:hypothetical protein